MATDRSRAAAATLPHPETAGVRAARLSIGAGALVYTAVTAASHLASRRPGPEWAAVLVLALASAAVTVESYFRRPWDDHGWPDRPGTPAARRYERLLLAQSVLATALVSLDREFTVLAMWVVGPAVAAWRGLGGRAPLFLGWGAALAAYGWGYGNGTLDLHRLADAAGSVAMTALLVALLFTLFGELRTRERLVGDLREANRALEAARSVERENAALRERERLARELHDLMGRSLVLVSVQLETARRLAAKEPSRVPPVLEATLEVVRDSTRELRRSLAGLRDGALEGRSLASAIPERLRAEADLGGWRTAWEVAESLALPPAVEDALWRVLQEALNNARKHARAGTVTVRLGAGGGAATLEVEDDGVGLPEPPPAGRYGLTGMRERVEALGGRLELSSGRPSGTVVRATVPLPVPGPRAVPA
jgi:signal transduction histidine kinase